MRIQGPLSRCRLREVFFVSLRCQHPALVVRALFSPRTCPCPWRHLCFGWFSRWVVVFGDIFVSLSHRNQSCFILSRVCRRLCFIYSPESLFSSMSSESFLIATFFPSLLVVSHKVPTILPFFILSSLFTNLPKLAKGNCSLGAPYISRQHGSQPITPRPSNKWVPIFTTSSLTVF